MFNCLITEGGSVLSGGGSVAVPPSNATDNKTIDNKTVDIKAGLYRRNLI